MSIRKISYKGKIQSVKQWSIELNISVSTIYGRLKLDWPPELVLSKDDYKFCNKQLAAIRLNIRLIDNRLYPRVNNHVKTTCCTNTTKCGSALPLNKWEDIKDNPSDCNYYCMWLGEFTRGDNPICQQR